MKNITDSKTIKIMLLIVTLIFSFQRCNSENNRPVKFIVLEGNKFRDLNKNGNLDPYEDWRLAVGKRIDDLMSKMTLDEKVGLMFPIILDIGKNVS